MRLTVRQAVEYSSAALTAARLFAAQRAGLHERIECSDLSLDEIGGPSKPLIDDQGRSVR